MLQFHKYIFTKSSELLLTDCLQSMTSYFSKKKLKYKFVKKNYKNLSLQITVVIIFRAT